MKPVLVAFLFTAAATSAADLTCKYVDKDGHVTYSNVPLKGAKKLQCFETPPAPVAPSARPEALPQAAQPAAPAPPPKVDSQTPRMRDLDRRRMLHQELSDEESKLAEARKALLEQEAIRSGDERNYQRVLDRLKPYQDTVAEHEKNVESIKQELANLR